MLICHLSLFKTGRNKITTKCILIRHIEKQSSIIQINEIYHLKIVTTIPVKIVNQMFEQLLNEKEKLNFKCCFVIFFLN